MGDPACSSKYRLGRRLLVQARIDGSQVSQ
jgi:hypothetical protein